jgi:tetratricopeptide (TPR) repeat protein
VLIQEDWKKNESQAASWEKDGHPAVLKALGRRYLALERWADGQRCLEAVIDRVPDLESHRALAEIYKKQGDEAKWLSTLESYLQQPDYGLSHAQVREQIAIHFMADRQWDKALPYAQDAAKTWSAWGLACAGVCYEGLQDWEQAEKYFRAMSERYDSSTRLVWYFFCRRTGHGDLTAAREFAMRFANAPLDKAEDLTMREISRFHILDGDLPKALKGLQTSYATAKYTPTALNLALVADELKDAKIRDEALRAVQADATFERGNRLGKWMAKDLAAGGNAEIDPTEADKLCTGNDPDEAIALCYYLGKYLDLHGSGCEAIRIWKRGMSYRTANGEVRMGRSLYTLAAAELLRRGVKPDDYKSLMPPESDKKKAEPAKLPRVK